jgi:multicomponent Na+:H+ antiporter subunit D
VNLIVALPFVVPMFAGALSLVFWSSSSAQRLIALAGTAAHLLVGIVLFTQVWEHGVLVLPAGDWPAPYGITIVADTLSALMILMTGVVGFATAVYSQPTVAKSLVHGGYFPLLHLLLAGVSGAFVTGDLFNLYVWFEVLLLASFALLAMGQERAQMAGALKYVVLNLFSSAMFLTALGLLYGLAGTMNMADLAVKLPQVADPGRVTLVAMLFLLAFSIKAAAFPVFFWLPASYHTPPVAVSALFAGLLTKVGVYSLYRMFTLVFTQDVAWTHGWLQVTAAFTLLAGVAGAMVQTDLRRTLSFLHVAQIGYMLMGLALYTPLALAGGVFYIAHHIVVKTNLFFIAGVITRVSGQQSMPRLGGYWQARPVLSLLFLLPALSLIGIPPVSGFWAKLIVIRAGIVVESWWLVAAALTAGLLTLYATMRIWMEVFWKAAPDGKPPDAPIPAALWTVMAMLTAATVLIGFAAEPVWQMAERAAAQLMDPSAYIEAVLGVQP